LTAMAALQVPVQVFPGWPAGIAQAWIMA
jgi:hypothetical protein